MKKIILLSIIFTSFLFSNTLFDISSLNFGSIEFKTKAKMRIYNNGVATFNLPIEIDSKTEAIQKTKTGYVRTSMFKIRFSAIKTNKMTFSTETITEFDTKYRLTKLTEKINRNGEKQTVICVPLREALMEEDYKKETGYKTGVFLLVCDNNSQKKMQSKLEKTKSAGIANFTTKKNFIMENNNIRYKIEETMKMTIDSQGNIQKISSKIKAKDLFSIKYTAKDIVQ